MLSLYTVCFFGHRQVDDFQSAEQAVESLIENLIQEHEFVEFLVGRDGKFDQIVSSTILRLKKRTDKANCSLTWVMPYLKADYINKGCHSNKEQSYDRPFGFVRVLRFQEEGRSISNISICRNHRYSDHQLNYS